MDEKIRNQSIRDSYQRIRWLVILGIIALITFYEALESGWLVNLHSDLWSGLDILFLLLFGAGFFWLVNRYLKQKEAQLAANQALEETRIQLADAYRQQRKVFLISQKLAAAESEQDVIRIMLEFSLDLIGAHGASFVPLDVHAQPLEAITMGEIPVSGTDAWIEYLASPAVRQECSACKQKEHLNHSCPLLRGAFLDTMGIYCLPLRRGEREFGVLNLYVPAAQTIEAEQQLVLRAMMDETSLAIEGVRLREQALRTMHNLRAAREQADLEATLRDLLENICRTMAADFAVVALNPGEGRSGRETYVAGVSTQKGFPLIEGILSSVIASGESVAIGDVGGESKNAPQVRAVMAVPLVAQARPVLGAILTGRNSGRPFTQHQLALLEIISSQAALVVENANLFAQLSYRTLLDERRRLAREIHDGLAQTLGFLKLKVAQLQSYLASGQDEAVNDTLDTCYQVVSEAYLDARQAIDGLRLIPEQQGIRGWLQRLADDFSDYGGPPVVICEPVDDVPLPSEVQAQLLRIVQEALSNIRKHAGAKHVAVVCRRTGGDLVLKIRDDGAGFAPEDVPGLSQHGLKGMRERAELIGADFQITSCPQTGTTVQLRMPVLVPHR